LSRTAIIHGLLAWLVIMALETVHGVLREILLVPRVGPETAGRIGWPIGLIIVIVTAWALARWIGLRDTRDLVKLGTIWAILTLGFESGIGLLRGIPLTATIGGLNPFSGSLLPLSLAVMLVAPLIAARLKQV
jgi:hypothetical protein